MQLPSDPNRKQYQFIDNLSKIVGNHTIKVGADHPLRARTCVSLAITIAPVS